MKKILIYIIILSTGFVFQSCDSWLDVKPSDRISEPDVFSSKEGFRMSLNGVYVELNSNSLYGKNLTYDFVDLLANYYAIHHENIDLYKMVREYYYQGTQQKRILEDTWSKAYNMIANLNIILRKCETNREVLPDDDYGIIKGEALALRAMLHFDMLRLFGPRPTNKVATTIPYYTEFVFNRPLAGRMDEFILQTLNDLDAAAGLMKEYDPVVDNGFNDVSTDNFKNFRQIRLNYYAVKALTARVALYGGLKEIAFEAAKEVLDVQATFFPFTTAEEAMTGNNPDRIFSKEVIFGSQISNRSGIYKSMFESLDPAKAYYINTKVCNDIIFNKELNDVRYKTWFSESLSVGNTPYNLFGKYKEGEDEDLLRNQILPLIRLGEVILIAAECDPDENKTFGVELINNFRTERGLSTPTPPITKYNIEQQIGYQYFREFIGEGQAFFYMKRVGKTSITSAHDIFTNIEISETQYRLPRPEEESKYD